MPLEILTPVPPVHPDAAAVARARHARLAKPPGSLGQLEELGVRLAAIAGRCPPPVPEQPVIVVAAGDHGVHRQGVSDWPQGVTAAMVETVAAGGAAINAIAATVGAGLEVIDVGTATAGDVPAGVRDDRVRAGTRDLTEEPAMTAEECRQAIQAGADAADRSIATGTDLLVLGDLGITNTTASACLIAALTGAPAAAVVGRGANRDDARLATKVAVVEAGLRRHGRDPQPDGVLASLGGFEHAALVGAILAAARAGLTVVLDGVISGAAALAAVALAPEAVGYLVAGHASAEPGARVALDHLGLTPLLDLGLRLGEGTGAAMAVPLVQAAAAVLSRMDLLESVVPSAQMVERS